MMTCRSAPRRILAVLSAGAAAVLLAGTGATAAPSAGSDDDAVPGAWIVTVKAGQSPDQVAADHRRDQGAQVDHVYRHALTGYAARMSQAAAANVSRDDRVLSVVADRPVGLAKPTGKPDRSGTVQQPAQTLPTGVNRVDADLASVIAGDRTGAADVDVAVIDTGIDLDHPDLDVVAGSGTNCIRTGSTDDGNGHGTHVAGTIAARDDSIGVVGVAPGARLHPVRVLDNRGSGSWSSVICGIDWVTAHAGLLEVANMSLGGGGNDSGGCTDAGLHQAICRAVAAGVTFVVAAGNDSDDAKNHVPAAYDQVITVSALADFDGSAGGLADATCRSDVDDTFADFSNYGHDVDLIAPGVCITSTWKGGGYSTISGTSMASPHVAGAAALYRASHPEASPTQVTSALQAAGNLDWSAGDDPDGVQEALLNVAVL